MTTVVFLKNFPDFWAKFIYCRCIKLPSSNGEIRMFSPDDIFCCCRKVDVEMVLFQEPCPYCALRIIPVCVCVCARQMGLMSPKMRTIILLTETYSIHTHLRKKITFILFLTKTSTHGPFFNGAHSIIIFLFDMLAYCTGSP